MVWVWKGDYLNLGAGAELGIYKRFEPFGIQIEHWLIDKDLSMPMTLEVEYEGEKIISYDPKRDDPKGQEIEKWWVTGFNPYYQDKKAHELTATYTIEFSDKKGMFEAFREQWEDDKRWDFDDVTYTATFTF